MSVAALADVLRWTRHHRFAGDLVGFLSGDNAMPQRELTRRQQAVAAANPGMDAGAINAAVFADAVASGGIEDAAAVLATLRQRYDSLIAEAQSAEHHGDIDGSLRLASAAHNHVPDGSDLSFSSDDDGNITATVAGGSSFTMTPKEYREYLNGLGTSFDHVIINGAAKNLGIACTAGMTQQ
jgi:hypothetical protein